MADKALDSLIRLQRWRLDEKRRQMGQLLARREALEQELQAVEDAFQAELALMRDGDPRLGFTFQHYLGGYEEKRDQYKAAIEQADEAVARMRDAMAEEFKARKTYEQVRDNRADREARERARKDQVFIDDVAADRHMRRQREEHLEDGGDGNL